MTVRPARPGESLPELVLASRQVVVEEAEALRAALEEFAENPQPGCPRELDGQAWAPGSGPLTEARQRLLGLTQHQARLICANAYDHLLTLGRALGSDGAMSLYAHASLSRVVCEAAVRLAWFLDPSVGCEERLMRGAVALLASGDEQLRGVMSIPARRFDPRVRQPMIDNCVRERDEIHALIIAAGSTIVRSGDGRKVARLRLDSPKVNVPVRLGITELMSELLPDSPSWYNLSSGITHSYFWMLRDAVATSGDEPLALTPNLMEVAAASQCAISASGLIIARCAAYNGHDPETHLQQTGKRREALDPAMRRLAIAQRAHGPA